MRQGKLDATYRDALGRALLVCMHSIQITNTAVWSGVVSSSIPTYTIIPIASQSYPTRQLQHLSIYLLIHSLLGPFIITHEHKGWLIVASKGEERTKNPYIQQPAPTTNNFFFFSFLLPLEPGRQAGRRGYNNKKGK